MTIAGVRVKSGYVIYRALGIIAGVLLVAYGINNMFELNILPTSALTAKAHELQMTLQGAYLMNVVRTAEIVMGLMLITNRYVAAGNLIMLTPFSINYFMFSLFLNQPGLPMSILCLFFSMYLIFYFKDKYKKLR